MSPWSGRVTHLSVALVRSGRLAEAHAFTVEETEVWRWESRLELVLHSLKAGPVGELWGHQGGNYGVRKWLLPHPLLCLDLVDYYFEPGRSHCGKAGAGSEQSGEIACL